MSFSNSWRGSFFRAILPTQSLRFGTLRLIYSLLQNPKTRDSTETGIIKFKSAVNMKNRLAAGCWGGHPAETESLRLIYSLLQNPRDERLRRQE
jgi:hypothetical protein